MSKGKQGQRLMTGALILTVAGLVSKMINTLFKLPLADRIGESGLSYYYNAFNIYNIFLSLFLGGVAATISKLVSEKYAQEKYDEAHQIFKYMMGLLLFIGAVSTVLIYAFDEQIILLAGWAPDFIYTVRAFAITPLFLAVIGGLRGYFQGMQDMKPAGLSQIADASLKVAVGMLLVEFVLGRGGNIAQAAGGAAWGAVIGTIASMSVLLIYYLFYLKRIKERIGSQRVKGQPVKRKAILHHMIWIAMPIALGASNIIFFDIIDGGTIIRNLVASGFAEEVAITISGKKSVVTTFINIPIVISTAIVVSVIPAISEAKTLGHVEQMNKKIDIVSRFAFLVALPATIGIMALSKPLVAWFFPDSAGSWALVALGSICILFIIMAQSYTAVLQGVGKIHVPLKILGMTVAIKLILNLVLINESLTMTGVFLASIIAYAFQAVANYYQVHKATGFKLNSGFILKVLVSGIGMGAVAYFSYKGLLRYNLHSGLLAMIPVGIGALTYGILVLVLGVLDEEDWAFLPMGPKLYEILIKLKLVRNK